MPCVLNFLLIILGAKSVLSIFQPCSSHEDCDKFDGRKNTLFCLKYETGVSWCERVSDGTTRSANVSKKCHNFPDGTNSCGLIVCPRGKFGAKTLRLTPHDVSWYPDKCTDCPAGSYTPTYKMSFCVCPLPGHQAKSTRDGQEECPAGTFNGNSLDISNWRPSIAEALDGRVIKATPCSTCEPCPARSFSIRGARQCYCPGLGEEALEDGAGVRRCKPGTYKSSRNCTLCKRCEEGKHAVNYGASYCSNPMPGHYAANDGTSIEPCKPGTFKKGTGEGSGVDVGGGCPGLRVGASTSHSDRPQL